MINEKRAWKEMAAYFRKWPLELRYGTYPNGICAYITALYANERISFKIYRQMLKRVAAHKRYNHTIAHFWPLTKAGNKSRVKFCEKQIQELECKTP